MEQPEFHHPPRFSARVLGWLLKDTWNTPLGDYEEYFNDMVAERGIRQARWWYRGQVLRLIPDQLLERLWWGIIMLRSYIVLGFRALRKDKVASVINITGLSLAVGIALVMFLFTQEINTLEDFHEHGDRVFLVGHTVDEGGSSSRYGTSPLPLGPALAADLPQVERAVRYAERDITIHAGDDRLRERMAFTDPGFFDMLTYPLVRGSAVALTDPSAVILSQDMADKYFRGQDPLGKEVVVTHGNGVTETLVVGAVAAPFPVKSSLRFDFLAGFPKWPVAGGADLSDWAAFTDGTFLQLSSAESARVVAARLASYVAPQNEANPSWQARSYFLDNIRHPDRFAAWDIHDRLLNAPPIWESIGVGLVGLLVLLIVCFNYITIALGSVHRRLREIGIRKSSGAEKRQLVAQFLTENLILCFVALVGGVFFAAAVVVPYFHSATSMSLTVDLFGNAGIWAFLVGVLVFIGLVSGAYPAFYVSSFQPVEILRGKLRLAEKKGLMRTLTTVQFVLTIMTIGVSLFLVSLDDSLTGGDWGYDEEAVIVVPVHNAEQYSRMAADVRGLPRVAGVAGAAHHVGSTRNAVVVEAEGVESHVLYYAVGPDYLSTMGLRLVSGRVFDGESSVVVNATLVAERGWSEPIGQDIRVGERSLQVVGVVDDFMVYPIEGRNVPVVFGSAPTEAFQFMTVRTHQARDEAVIAPLRTIWEAHAPGTSFAYEQQTGIFREYDLILDLTMQFTRYLGLFALFISCMGLFGMASQRAAKRLKEVGIRKAMGASPAHLILLVNRSFLTMLVVATLIATPLCYFGLRAALDAAPVDIPVSPVPFVLANLLVFALAALSLTLQTRRLVRINPADVLRYE